MACSRSRPKPLLTFRITTVTTSWSAGQAQPGTDFYFNRLRPAGKGHAILILERNPRYVYSYHPANISRARRGWNPTVARPARRVSDSRSAHDMGVREAGRWLGPHSRSGDALQEGRRKADLEESRRRDGG